MIEYSFIVPIFNDQYLLRDFCLEYQRVMRDYLGVEDISLLAELIVVNDGSERSDPAELRALCDEFRFLRVINLSRNFGQHIAISCGYRNARGNYVGMLNVDMEDPPDQIPLLVDHLRGGDYDIVYGLRRERRSPLGVRMTSLAFNYILNKLTGYDVPLNTATLRVMNRRFLDAYNSLSESSRFIPGLEMWLGFRRGYVDIAHRARTKGRSSYRFRTRLRMAFESIVSFSDLPLRLVAFGGLIIAIVGFLLTFGLIVAKLAFVEFEAGYPSTIALIIFIGGVQILVIGLASIYIGRVLKEVQNRPLYLVRDTLNFDEPEAHTLRVGTAVTLPQGRDDAL